MTPRHPLKIILAAFVLGISLARPPSTVGSVILAGKERMIAEAQIVAVVDIVEIEEIDIQDPNEIFIRLRQKAKARCLQILKGRPDEEFTFYVPSFYPCAVVHLSAGRHIVFLASLSSRLVGYNWSHSYRPISNGYAEWYPPRDYGAFRSEPLPQVLADIQTVINKQAYQQRLVSAVCKDIMEIKPEYRELSRFSADAAKGIWLSYGRGAYEGEMYVTLHFETGYWGQLLFRLRPSLQVDLPEISDTLMFSVYSENLQLKKDLITIVMQQIMNQVSASAEP